MKKLLLIAALAACILTSVGAIQAAEEAVWQIGKADNSYDEFAIARDYGSYPSAFSAPKPFDPSRDDPAQSWPFIQPGPWDIWANSRRHTLSVEFDVNEPPIGMYTLTLDFIDTQEHGAPLYEIAVNGRSGRFKLPGGAGDGSLSDPSKGREYLLRIPFAADYLKQGRNRITMTTVEGSWAIFDCLSLVNSPDSAMPEPSIKGLSVAPTIRFVQDGDKLRQVIEMSAEFASGTPACSATVTTGGTTETFTVEPDLLGTARRELYVDEITKPTTAEVSITIGGTTKTAVCELKPQRHWKLYVQASSHVDIGYTNWQERVAELHNDNMTNALELCKQYPDFKWNTEVAWVQDNYLSMMPVDKKNDFIKYAKAGQIGCQAIYGNMLTGICSHESLIRDLYYARNMSRKHGIPYDMAVSSDIPTQVWTLPTVLAGAGLKYFSAGLNLTRGNSFDKLFNKPFYWQGPDSSKVLTWFSPGYAYASNLHLFHGVSEAEPHVQKFLQGFDRQDYPYDAVLAFGGVSDNVALNIGLAPTVSEWNKKYAYPKIILCRGPEFFQHIEANYKDKIPTFSGCGGVYWEDGAGSSAMETAKVRQAKQTLAAAEKMSSLASLLHGTPYPKAEFDLAWKNAILYDEHTWGAAQSISQPNAEQTVHQWKVKAQFAVDAGAQADKVLQKSLNALTKPLRVSDWSILAFNPSSRPASGWVSGGDGQGHTMTAYAKDVPPLGYKLVGGAKITNLRQIPLSGAPAIENSHYRVRFDRTTGAVTSIYDKQLKRELVDQTSAYKLNQYIYTLGRPQGQDVRDIKDVTREGVTSPVRLEAFRYPGGVLMDVHGEAKNAKWWSRVSMDDGEKSIYFTNTVNKRETTEKEAGYFAFPFALNKPQWHIELPDGVVCPNKNMLPGADMEWYCTQNFVAASDPSATIVWTSMDAPLLTIGDINRDTFKSPMPVDSGRLFSYAFNNYWFTNYKASQGGEMTFRYSLTSMPKYDPAAAAQFGESVRNPLIAEVLEPNKKGRALPTASVCSVDAPNVSIQAIKQAESGKGIIIRLRELSGKKTTAVINVKAGKFKQAHLCNLVEDPKTRLTLTKGKVTVPVAARGLATVLLTP